jgi:hypothetical protein
LNELICLTSVDGTLDIDNNNTLTNLDGLGALISVGEDLAIEYNDDLTSVQMPALTSVGEDLEIQWNQLLTDVSIPALTSVTDYLRIFSNAVLTNVDMSLLPVVGTGLVIAQNDALESLDGLSAITSVSDELVVYWNPTLPDCETCDLLDQLNINPISTSP